MTARSFVETHLLWLFETKAKRLFEGQDHDRVFCFPLPMLKECVDKEFPFCKNIKNNNFVLYKYGIQLPVLAMH